MRSLFGDSVVTAVVAIAIVLSAAIPASSQVPAYRAPRTADGKPDLNGIWQALNTADWDLEGHAAAKGPVPELGAVFSVPPGLTVTWLQYGGPAQAVFEKTGSIPVSNGQAANAVRFSVPGTYRLRTIANDGALSTTADVVVTVK
jgi:hypothetical protein